MGDSALRRLGASARNVLQIANAHAVVPSQRRIASGAASVQCVEFAGCRKAHQWKQLPVGHLKTSQHRGHLRRWVSCGRVQQSDENFVSEHAEFDDDRVQMLLEDEGLEYKQKEEWLNVRDCPEQVCKATPKQIKSKHKESNKNVFSVNAKTGHFHCFRCTTKGNWFELRQLLTGSTVVTQSADDIVRESSPSSPSPSSTSPRSPSQPTPPSSSSGASDSEVFAAYERALSSSSQVMRWLQQERHISLDTLTAFRVGACLATFAKAEHTCVTFPWFNDQHKDPLRAKLRSITDKKCIRLTASSNETAGIFGWNTVTDETAEVVLTEGEIDALTVSQETGAVALSLPNGAASLPGGVVKMLERFQTIVLWLDDDAAGQAGVAMCVKKLGKLRCRVVRTRGGRSEGPKDANDALVAYRRMHEELREEREVLEERKAAATTEEEVEKIERELEALASREKETEEQHSLKAILARQEMIKNEAVISFAALRSDVERELCGFEEAQGTPFGDSLPTLTAILKGHRPGEMSVYTGRTGEGKTTLLSQLSLDLCLQGCRTLWGSFEVQNAKLVAKMMQQQQRQSLRGCSPDEFDAAADEFAQLPMWFLKYFGSTKVEHVLDAMEYAVHAHDVQHVVLDNLQFMTFGMGGDDKFAMIDTCLAKVRQFATDHNVHVSLVMHPRKEEPGKEIHMGSVYGSGKATQDSDNVIIIQHVGKLRYLDIQKNRFDGTRGKVPFAFNSHTLRYSEISAEEADDLLAQDE